MSKSQIEEAFAIGWGIFALAAWKFGAVNIVTFVAGFNAVFSLFASWLYTWKQREEEQEQ